MFPQHCGGYKRSIFRPIILQEILIQLTLRFFAQGHLSGGSCGSVRVSVVHLSLLHFLSWTGVSNPRSSKPLLPLLIKSRPSHTRPSSTFYRNLRLQQNVWDLEIAGVWLQGEEETKWNLIEQPGQTSGLEQHSDECQMWSSGAQTLITRSPQKKTIFNHEEPLNAPQFTVS